jgi:hypothetical protein
MVKLLIGIAALTQLIETSPAQSWITNGLVAYYPFNGNANDASGYGDNAFVNGATLAIDRYGNPSSCYSLLASNHASITNSGAHLPTGHSARTFALWIKPNYIYPVSGYGTESFFGYGIGSRGLTAFLNHDPDTNVLYISMISTSAESMSYWTSYQKWDFNIWHQIAYVIDTSSNLTIYVDSSLAVANTPATNVGFDIPKTSLNIGGFQANYFDGKLDDIRIYNRALSSNEVQQLYAIEAPQPPVITSQPQSVITNQGATATFSVSATGTNGVWVQWYKDGVGLPNATNTVLTITNARPPNIGNYMVVVSGYGGSVTSSVVSLSLTGVNSALWQGLVAYYLLDGSASDASGFSRLAPTNACFSTDRIGNASKCLVVTNVSQALTIDSTFGLPFGSASRTVAAWVSFGSTNGVRVIFDYGAKGPQKRYAMYVDSASAFGVSNDATNYWSPIPLANGTRWYHLTTTFDGISLQLYKDGSSVYRGSNITDIATTDSGVFVLGASLYGLEPMNGKLDDVRIYNRALSSTEVAQLYASEAVPPSITTQPYSVVAYAHSSASFTAAVAGSEPLSCQWTFYGTNLANSTNTSIMLTNIQPSNLGSYRLLVTNAAGSVASSAATLFMYPYIATPFAGAVTYWGQSNTFSVAAWGNYLQYQWYLNGAEVPNATSASLTIPAIQFTNAGMYSVVVSSIFGSVTNTPVQVVVNPANVSLKLYPNVVIEGTVGYNYLIQMSTNLFNTNAWITMTNFTLTQPIQYWDDISDDSTKPGRYYRVLPGQ